MNSKSNNSGKQKGRHHLLPVRPYSFRKGFKFGAATSAYQVEGAVDRASYGRGPSIWDTYFAKRPQLPNGDVACDHYNRMPQDVAMMKRMGLQAYRFSVAWPRVLPDGCGHVNEQGMDFYDRLVDRLLSAGIEPFLTLYHWDLPQRLEDEGGWLSRNTAARFADYAAVVAKRLGDRVTHFGTLNEPEVIVAGYTGTGLAPAANDPRLRVKVAHTLMLAHGLGVQALRACSGNLQIGLSLNLVPAQPSDWSNPKACAAARKHWLANYALYLEAILKACYPDVVLEEAATTGAEILPGDMATIAQRLDYLGINWYLRHVVDEQGRVLNELPAARKTQMGWEIYAPALTSMLSAMQREYHLPPIYITENGAALDDTMRRGRIHDLERTRYLHDHLNALEEAAALGIDIAGYFVWSLMDNLEWSLGFSKTFGLVHVGSDLKRTIKDSGLWYRDVIRANG